MLPGSLLVLYTDGLIEVPGVDMDEALADLAEELGHATDQPLEAVADRLIAKATGNRERGDDTALLLLRPER